MRIYGIDFTSRPRRRKPITCLEATLDGNTLKAGALQEWQRLQRVRRGVATGPAPGSRASTSRSGNHGPSSRISAGPRHGRGYVAHAHALGRKGFRAALDTYRAPRPAGDKEHRRQSDIAAGSISPQKLYGVPVGLMFFEGAPRLLEAGVTIPGLTNGDPGQDRRRGLSRHTGAQTDKPPLQAGHKKQTDARSTRCPPRAATEDRKRRAHGVLRPAYRSADDPGR